MLQIVPLQIQAMVNWVLVAMGCFVVEEVVAVIMEVVGVILVVQEVPTTGHPMSLTLSLFGLVIYSSQAPVMCPLLSIIWLV